SNREQGDQQGFLSELQRKYGTNILHIPYDSPWIRDYGPLQRKSAEHGIQWLDFDYAFNRPFDEIIPAALADHLNLPISDAVSYLEGGSIISNGRSLCAMTDRSLEEAEMNHEEEFDFNEFKMKIGCTVLAIIPALTNESTGHADIIAQFLTENIVAVASTMGASTVIDDQLEKAVSTLKASARIMGQQLQILRLPLYIDGEYFYSYINGTRLKQVYLAPSFKSVPPEMETAAYAAINAALPETILIPVPADSMAERGGAIHCITLGLNLPEEYVNPGYAAKWNELHIAKTLLPVSITIQN
ncbi:agmatine deiminase family protein, partial [bacterium]|nr:agmatine deiminase family protein [bacterium]